MNYQKILKAIVAGLVAGSFFIIILPAFLIILSIYYELAIINKPYFIYLGSFLIILGVINFWYCTGLFAFFGRGTPAPIEPPDKLVVKGIYKYTRNPMYFSYFFIILGEFFLFGYMILFYYFLFIIFFINFYLIFFEEPALKRRFGEEYLLYKKRVPRWISLSLKDCFKSANISKNK